MNAYEDCREKVAKWEKLMEQRKRVFPYMAEYRAIKEMNLRNNQNGLRERTAEGKVIVALSYTTKQRI